MQFGPAQASVLVCTLSVQPVSFPRVGERSLETGYVRYTDPCYAPVPPAESSMFAAFMVSRVYMARAQVRT